ncbi:putative tricarballylate dehydrogenase [Diplodia seriata]|uniref:Putative tricarballylate dehydrogenase n=1 Tax=Diplodia seriata TaxID=420778 RepID=A0A0G2E840_9PEZI|nr:putative tricarballylate dehydrogenase [Diplodia seriata]
MPPLPDHCTVLVIGSGNAGLSAAISAAQNGAPSVLLVDKCPASWAGGNTYFTAGAYRTPHAGLPTLLPLVNNAPPDPSRAVSLPPYPAAAFASDLRRVTRGRADPALAAVLVEDALPAVRWLAGESDGGKGLVADELAAAARHGVRVAWSTALVRLLTTPPPPPSTTTTTPASSSSNTNNTNNVIGAVLRQADGVEVPVLASGGVVLAAGGFEASGALRAQHLGPEWGGTRAFVRGTPFNTGDGLAAAARDAGAARAGDWAGCHAVAWDANAAPEGGDRERTNEYTKSGYPLGVMVDVEGRRAFNEAAKRHREKHPERVFNPAVKDGVATEPGMLEPPKSNWALPIEKPPFLAVKVGCGITFTFEPFRIFLSVLLGADRPKNILVGVVPEARVMVGLTIT